MFKESSLLFYVAETSIHPGSGSEVGIVDLPIQREVHTKIPIIRGSSLKGAFRDYWRAVKDGKVKGIEGERRKTAANYWEQIFGPEPKDLTTEKAFASAASFTDARVLLFPVKSYRNIFAYITSPAVLKKFLQDMKWAGIEIGLDVEKIEPGSGGALAGDEMITKEKNSAYVILEEHRFEVKGTSDTGKKLAAIIFGNNQDDFRREKVERHLVVLSNEDFEFFVKHSTEVVARIKIDQSKGTVQGGALWYEENLPSETILYNLVLFSDCRSPEEKQKSSAEEIKRVFEEFHPKILQLGGNETVGRGFLRIYTFHKEGKNE